MFVTLEDTLQRNRHDEQPDNLALVTDLQPDSVFLHRKGDRRSTAAVVREDVAG